MQVLERWNRGQDTERLNEMSLDSCLTVSSIRIHRLNDLVWMDQTAFLSLKIFSQESHPSNFKRGQASSAKEGIFIQFFLLNQEPSHIMYCTYGS